MNEDQQKRALEAINAILVMLRHVASEDKCSARMHRILDSAEVIPLYLLQGEQGWERSREMLEAMAKEFPFECGLALRRFMGQSDG